MFKKKQPVNYLDMVPVWNVKEFIEEEGITTLLVPKYNREWMRKWLLPNNKPKYFRIHLDETGSKVWNLIDGSRTVGQICGLLVTGASSEKNDDVTNMELRVTKYLSQLYRNKFVVFVKK